VRTYYGNIYIAGLQIFGREGDGQFKNRYGLRIWNLAILHVFNVSQLIQPYGLPQHLVFSLQADMQCKSIPGRPILIHDHSVCWRLADL
jgi:hypothetical protein